MHGMRPARDPISQLVSVGGPLLIFEVDAAGVDRPAARPERCHVRLVGSRTRSDSNGGRGGELSAVLVLRALTPSRLRSCLRAVKTGSGRLPPELLCSMLPDAQLTPEQLTERELEVLRHLSDGDSTREIADSLCYSERTVKT